MDADVGEEAILAVLSAGDFNGLNPTNVRGAIKPVPTTMKARVLGRRFHAAGD